MKKHNILTKSLAAIVAVTLVGQSAFAATYIANDLILGFRATGGTGATQNVVVNLGQASTFTGAVADISTVVGTASTGSDLNTAFTTWTTHRSDGSNGGLGSDVIWSITGTSGSFAAVGADPAKTVYATRAITTAGTHPSAWQRGSDIAQGVTTNLMKAFGNQYTTYTATANGGVIQLTGDVNSYSSYQPGGTVANSGPTPGTSFKAFNPSAETSSALSSAELFRMTPGSGSGKYVGTFTLNADGTLSFSKTTSPSGAPTFAAPATNGNFTNSVSVNYILPAKANAGTVRLDFNNGSSHTLTLATAREAFGAHTFSFNPQNPTASASVASGSALPDGIYSVSLTYQDEAEHPVSTAVVKTNVTIDSHAPVIDDSEVSTTGYDSTHGIPDLRGDLVVTDFSSVTTVQSPVAGSILAAGEHTITFTSTDALNNVAVETTDITVDVGDAVTTVFASGSGVPSAGSAVPGAGVTPGIAANATFTKFGVPAVNDSGDVAFIGFWSAAAVGPTPASKGFGVFGGSPTALIAKFGDAVPGIPASSIKSFKDPVINADGKVAFGATMLIGSGGVTAADDTVLLTDGSGSLMPIAREGFTPDCEGDGAKILTISNYSIDGAEVLFSCKFKLGDPAAVTALNDQAAFAVDANGIHHVIREGDSIPGITGTGATVKGFYLLGAVAYSSAQTRGHVYGTTTFKALLVNGTSVLVDSVNDALNDVNELSVIAKGSGVPGVGSTTGGLELPTAVFKSLGPVAADGAQEAVNAILVSAKTGPVVGTNSAGIFLGTGSAFEPVVRSSDSAGGGFTFSKFFDPLISNGSVAFPALLLNSTTGIKTESLWWKPASGSLSEIARLTDQPPSTTSGGVYRAFKSLALTTGSNGAPIYYAQLTQGLGGVDATNDFGLFAVNSGNTVSKIVREGDVIGGKTVKTLTVISSVSGSIGVTHSFNSNRRICYLALFADGTNAIITTVIP